MRFLNRLILDNKFLQRKPIWWWYRFIRHSVYRFDDNHLQFQFWTSLNSGYYDMHYKYQFQKIWGRDAKPETILLSPRDFEALQARLAEPPKFNQGLSDLLNRKSPWDDGEYDD